MQQPAESIVNKELRHIVEKQDIIEQIEKIKNRNDCQVILMVNSEGHSALYQNGFNNEFELTGYLLHVTSTYIEKTLQGMQNEEDNTL